MVVPYRKIIGEQRPYGQTGAVGSASAISKCPSYGEREKYTNLFRYGNSKMTLPDARDGTGSTQDEAINSQHNLFRLRLERQFIP